MDPRGPQSPFLGAFGRRLFLSLALLSLLMVAAVGLLGYTQARRALMAEAKSHMESVARERRARLEAWFEERLGDMTLLAGLVERELAAGGKSTGDLRELLATPLARQSAYRRCLYVDKTGAILAEAGEPGHEPCKAAELPELAEALASGRAVLGSVSLDPAGDPVMHLSAPVREGGRLTGAVLAVMRPGETIHPILADTTGLGESGETYLVGADTLMLTPSRHMNHPPALTHKMPTPGVLACLAGGDGTRIYRGYLGQEVLGAYQWLPRQRWALLAEIQTNEAFAPLRAIARQTVLLGLVALLVALLLGVTLSRRLSRPIGELAAASERVAAGDLAPPRLRPGPGEIGALTTRFQAMVGALARSRQELERSQQRLVQAETLAAVGRLAAGLVHEMRNPMSAMKTSLSALARSEALSAVETEQLQLAREQGERLERMLDELLDYGRPVELSPRLLAARDLMDEVQRLTDGERVALGIGLELDLPDETLRLLADRELLVRALVNVVVNAAQASEPGGTVSLAARREARGVVFEVSDRGRGMPASVRERIFDPFFTTREEGVGLGMSVVDKSVDLHGGELEIESTEGVGTRIRVIMPMESHGRQEVSDA